MLSAPELPRLPEGFTYRLDLARAATPRLLQKRPVHRWFAFPHSYSPELVEAVLRDWNLPSGAAILDPFVGAGTTLLVAKEQGYEAVGTDLSPLAVLVSRVKVNTYDCHQLQTTLNELRLRWDRKDSQGEAVTISASERLKKAFTPAELSVLFGLREEILSLPEETIRDFFMVALLSILSEFSRAVADGGWFRWVERPDQARLIAPRFWEKAGEMIRDLLHFHECKGGKCEVYPLDARYLHYLKPRCFDALITSPPYANRHDYSRVFQIELLLIGQREEDIFTLRYRSLRSHVEARQPENDFEGYTPPALLTESLYQLPEKVDKRIRRMIEGYFQDMFLVLCSAKDVLKEGARVAMVVGNVRHAGVIFPVDEILATIGECAGYRFLESWVIRLRGNSAQQMGMFGRMPSRETVVILER